MLIFKYYIFSVRLYASVSTYSEQGEFTYHSLLPFVIFLIIIMERVFIHIYRINMHNFNLNNRLIRIINGILKLII